MAITVRIPTALRTYASNEAKTQLEAKTVGEALDALIVAHPGLREHLMEDSGEVRSFVNVFLGETDVRDLQGPQTAVNDGDTLLIIPSVAGGC